MTPFIVSSFGLFVMGLFEGLFTTPSWQTFTVLARGWAVAGGERQTITTYLWLTGATTVKHFSRFYDFLGGALYHARWSLWARIIGCAAQWVPAEAPIVIVVDDSTKKKAGRQIEGVATTATARARRAKNIARYGGSTLCGRSCGCRCRVARPECQCPHRLVALPERGAGAHAQAPLSVPQYPGPGNRGLCRGPTPRAPDSRAGRWRLCHQGLPPLTGHGRCGLPYADHGQALCPPAARVTPRRGCPPKKGPLLGSPKTLAHKRHGWQPHPSEAGALVQAWDGLWHAVLPGRLIRVVVVRRPRRPRSPGRRKPLLP